MNFIKCYWNKLIILFFCLISLFFAFSLTFDEQANVLIDKSFTQAVLVFGSAKALNAVISLAQGTELNLPFLTVSVGQILDPINDLVEQFSFIMLASMTSLGIQKIISSFVTNSIFNIFLCVSLIIANIWLFVRFKNDEKIRHLFFRLAIILLFLRFAVPLTSYVNKLAYDNFVKPYYNIEQLNQSIVSVQENVNNITNDTIAQKEEQSFIGKITEKFDSNFYTKKVQEYNEITKSASEYIVDLIIVFIFQTILLPIVFLIILYYFVKGVFLIGRNKVVT